MQLSVQLSVDTDCFISPLTSSVHTDNDLIVIKLPFVFITQCDLLPLIFSLVFV